MRGIHKETFKQSADSGIPSHWVVLYWPEGKNPETDFNEAEYFSNMADAVEFENILSGGVCQTCQINDIRPSHNGSIRCESGSIASGGNKSHCSCDICF
jgi:hypothetical protein